MDKKNILITGARGNIGTEVLRGFKTIQSTHCIYAADYLPASSEKIKDTFPDTDYRQLDFAEPESFDKALKDIDIVFLLRPPQLADVKKYFDPFLAAMKKQGVSKVVFLSVQGAKTQSFIPHHKLEKLILEYGMQYVFLRPSYFMQNITTTLFHEIQKHDRIFIPSGKLRFNWVDARDIGLVGAHVLNDFEKYSGKALEVTGSDFCGFDEVVRLINQHTSKQLRYESPNLLRFYFTKRKQGVAPAMILVMIMLHFLPRLGKNESKLTQTVKEITGKVPGCLEDFIVRNKSLFD